MTGPLDTSYLDGLYAGEADPWRLADGFYEQRKRDLILSSLTRQSYRNGFEPACANGDLTMVLAPRCDVLLASDYHPRAVDTAARRARHLPSVTVEQMLLPDQWPASTRFDLIVLSEFGYYVDPDAWRATCEGVASSLADDATVLACHWRHPFPQRRSDTESLHRQLERTLGDRAPGMKKVVGVLDEDFALDVWSRATPSPAQQEGRR